MNTNYPLFTSLDNTQQKNGQFTTRVMTIFLGLANIYD